MNSTDSNTVANINNSKLSTRDLTLIALFTALMAICSWISIPATVPFTLQTLGVFLACALLGGRRGTIAVVVYLILGAIGIPVFSGFTGGIGHLLGPTGGYIIGFIFSALVMWLAESLQQRRSAESYDASAKHHGGFNSNLQLALSMVLGLIVCYAFGTAWFMAVYTKSNDSISLMTALDWCVFPYIIPDAIKIIIAVFLTRRLRPALTRISA